VAPKDSFWPVPTKTEARSHVGCQAVDRTYSKREQIDANDPSQTQASLGTAAAAPAIQIKPMKVVIRRRFYHAVNPGL
jgi:hypothetical protein